MLNAPAATTSAPVLPFVAPAAAAAPAPADSDGGFAREMQRAQSQQRGATAAASDAHDVSDTADAADATEGADAAAALEPPSARAKPGAAASRSARAGLRGGLDAAASATAMPAKKLPARADPQAAENDSRDAAAGPQAAADDPDVTPPLDLAAFVAALPPQRGPADAAPASTAAASGADSVSAAQDTTRRAATGRPAWPDRDGREDASGHGTGTLPQSQTVQSDAGVPTQVGAAALPAAAPPTAAEAAAAVLAASGVKPTPGPREEPAATPAAGVAAVGSGHGLLPPGLARFEATTAVRTEFLPVVPGTPEFAPALGAQLSVLARDGVQHALLQLHPADLGPIGVRISLDGSEAQIDFSAGHAATRQALEDAVPVLAGALRESGLTLTGGGVFDQPRQGRDLPSGAARPAAWRADAGDAGADAIAAPPAHARPRGVLDLYA